MGLSAGTVITEETKVPNNRVLLGALLFGCIVSFVVARARERRSREKRETRAAAREEKRVARKARANEVCVGLTTQKYDWLMSEALTRNCQQSKMMAEALQECLSENRSIRKSHLRVSA